MNAICRICGATTEIADIGRSIRGYELSRCSACETIRVEQVPAPADLKAVYEELFSRGRYDQHRVEFEELKAGRSLPNSQRQHLLRRVARMTPGRRISEIGGGTGKFGREAVSSGWTYTNYDVSETAVACCRELGLQAHSFSLNGAPPLPPASADVVVMWEVLEHVSNVRAYLDVIRRALRPGGVFLMSTPNYLTPSLLRRDDWGPLSSPPVHLNFFDPATLSNVLTRSGFAVPGVFRRRLYRPGRSLASWVRAIRFALLLDEPETLYAIAR